MLFEKASRMKLRFQLKGNISVEELWDLSKEELDTYASSLFEQMEKSTKHSLLKKKDAKNSLITLKYDIVKHIIETKLIEEEESAIAIIKKQEKEKLLALLVKKQEEKLAILTEEEIQKKLEELK
jgi:organic radical activating enzyme